MRKWYWLGFFPAISLAIPSFASEKDGYSYITIGVENVTYKESYSGQGVANSDVSASSPMLNTGGLYRVNEKFDFSIDAMATFSPVSSTETWHRNTGQAYQKNQFEYLKTSTNILLHYKWTPYWRIVAGPSLTYQSYKRYGLEGLNGYENPVFRKGDTWEEKSTDIFIDAGVAYDNGNLLGDNRWKITGRWIIGAPIWSKTENTKFVDTTFDDFGFRTSLEGTLSYEVTPGLHLGWYVMLGYEKRFESDPEPVSFIDNQGDEKQGLAILPDAETYSFNTGIQALWHF